MAKVVESVPQGRRSLRIGIVTQYFPPEPAPILDELTRYLHQRGHRVRVLTGLPNYPTGRVYKGFGVKWRMKESHKGVEVKRVLLMPSHSTNMISRAVNYLSFALSAVLEFGWLLRADVVYVYGSGVTAALAPRLWNRRVPYVLHVQDLWPESVLESGMVRSGLFMRLTRALLGAYCSWVYRGASAVLGTSPTMTKELIQRGADPAMAQTVYNWGSEAHAHIVPRTEFVPKKGLSLLYAGNLGQAQDLATVLEGLALVDGMSGIRLNIVGGGIEERNLRKLVAELGLVNVEFYPRVSLDEISQFYANCDFHLIPLRDVPVFKMTIPSKLQAGLMRGTPVITSVQGDVAELVARYGVGLVVSAQNPQAWACAIREACTVSHARRQDMSSASLGLYATQMSQSQALALVERALFCAQKRHQ